MAELDIGSAVASNLTNAMKDYSVPSKTTDGPTDQKETTYMNSHWTQYFGYYKKIPELSSVIDAKATWTVGKGFVADPITTMLLDTIKGNGKDTFNTILENAIRTYQIGGDSYAEIIRDDDGILINLKPLDPGTMRHVANRKGRIIRFEQVMKGKPDRKFKPEEIFYLARNRVADEIHGQSMVEKLIEIVLFKNEAMTDWKKALHRNVYPQIVWHLDTDDPVKIAAFKAMQDKANVDRENVYIPKGAVEREIGGVPPNATLNPLATIEMLDAKFYEAAQVPKIIVGGVGGITEAAVKIAYLAYQQTIEEEQLFVEEEVLSQLNLVIDLQFPASLENEMLSDKPKVEERGIEQEQANQPNDTTTEMEGKK